MFGIGSSELLVILVVALIALGPKSLASVSRSLGRAVGEFRRVSTDFQRTLNAEVDNQELKENKSRKTKLRKEEKEAPSAKVILPEDSPVAQAIAKAKAEAEGQNKSGDEQNG